MRHSGDSITSVYVGGDSITSVYVGGDSITSVYVSVCVYVRTRTCIFMDGFQNNTVELLSFSLSQMTNFRLKQTERVCKFADDSFKLDENSRKLSKRAENTVEKAEIPQY